MQSRRHYKAGKLGSYHRNSCLLCKDISHFKAKIHLNGNSYKHLIFCMYYRVLNSFSSLIYQKKNNPTHTVSKNYQKNQYCKYTLGSEVSNIRSTFLSLIKSLKYMLSMLYYHICCSLNYMAYKYLKRCQGCCSCIYC